MTKNLKKTIFIIVIILGFLITKTTGFVNFIGNINTMQEYFQGLGITAYITYILIYIIVAIFMFPASLVTIGAGIIFGPILGGLLSLVGATIGAVCSFLIAKYMARDYIVKKFKGNILFDKIEKGVKENGKNFLILTRLVPVFPYNIQNYAYGLTSMKVFEFFIVSFICMAPGAFIYAFMAGEIVTSGVSLKLLLEFAIAGVILFIISLIPKYYAKKRGIELDTN
ncbi:MAG: TVP38/TMEM64 family protein [Lachnospirales bacterium]